LLAAIAWSAADSQQHRNAFGEATSILHCARMQRLLLIAGVILALAGLAWPWIARLGLGHLPGDIRIERPNFAFYLPIGSSLLLSVVLSLLLALIGYFWRR
jgi:hypothetical protein